MYNNKLKRVIFLIGLIVITLGGFLLGGCSSITEKTITISSIKDVSVNIGAGKNVTVVTTPQDVTIKAVSNNPNISTVTVNGKVLTVTGIAEGQAEITITASKVGYKTSTMKFKVNVVGSRNITNISIINDLEVSYGTSFEELDLPSAVEVTLDDGSKKSLGVTWSEGNYDANSAGTYELSGSLTLIAGVTNTSNLTAKVKVIVGDLVIKNVESVGTLQDMKVAYGIVFSELDLPPTVEVTLDDGSKKSIEVTWSEGNYDGNNAGIYELEGTLILVDGITNSADQKGVIQIIVNQVPIITGFVPESCTVRIWDELDLKVTAEDPDNDELTYRWEVNEVLLNNEENSSLHWQFLENRITEITVYVSDGFNEVYQTQSFEINALPEIISLNATKSVIKVGEETEIEVIAVDNENDNLTYQWEVYYTIIEGETGSSLTWTATTTGEYYIYVYVSDDGGQNYAAWSIPILVVDRDIPVVRDISIPEDILATQKVILKADYYHMDPTKDLTIRWEVSGGTITNGQGTGEIEWVAPSETGWYSLNFFLDDGETQITENIDIYVTKPSIDIYCNEVAIIGEENYINISVANIYIDTEIKFTVSASDGDLRVDSTFDNSAYYYWVAPEIAGVVSITFETTINGVVFTDTIEVTVIDNSPPIIQNVLVNNNTINLDELLILNVNESYNFEVVTSDPNGDVLDIQWYFTNLNTYQQENFFGPTAEHISSERCLTASSIVVDDAFSSVTTIVYIIFEDGSVNDLTDLTKIQTIETICGDMAAMINQNDIEVMTNYLHYEKEVELRDLLEYILYSGALEMHLLDRDITIFDPIIDVYKTHVLYKLLAPTGETLNVLISLSFKLDDTGEIKLYEIELYN